MLQVTFLVWALAILLLPLAGRSSADLTGPLGLMHRWPQLSALTYRHQIDLIVLMQKQQRALQSLATLTGESSITLLPPSRSKQNLLVKFQLVALLKNAVQVKLVIEELRPQDAFWGLVIAHQQKVLGPEVALLAPTDRFFLVSDDKKVPIAFMVGSELLSETNQRWLLIHTIEGDFLTSKIVNNILKIFLQSAAELGFQRILLPADSDRSHVANGRFYHLVHRQFAGRVLSELNMYYQDKKIRQEMTKRYKDNNFDVRPFLVGQVLPADHGPNAVAWEVVISYTNPKIFDTVPSQFSRQEYLQLLFNLLATRGEHDPAVVTLLQATVLNSEQLLSLQLLLKNPEQLGRTEYLQKLQGEWDKINFDYQAAQHHYLPEQGLLNASDAWVPANLAASLESVRRLSRKAYQSCRQALVSSLVNHTRE